jgi:hypothetical protein
MKTWIVVAAIALAPGGVLSQTAEDSLPAAPLGTGQFAIGERLLYDAKVGPIRLGEASMEVLPLDTVRGEATTHFRFLINGNLVGVYRMRDRFDSWVGRDDFASRRYIQDKNESGNVVKNEYEIFPDSGIYWQNGVDTAMTSSDNPLDDTAFFYFVRTLDLEPGDSLEFHNYFRPDRNPVIVRVLARDTIEVPAGEFATILIQPIIKGGLFDGNSDGRMWISDDEHRFIVQMKTKIAFMTLTMRLTEIQGPAAEDSTPAGGRTGSDSRF